MIKHLSFLSLLLLASTSAFRSAHGVVIYNNGLPNQASGNEMTQWIQAEDFTLTSAYNLTDVRFWSVEQSTAYQGSISWAIYANAGAIPGATLFSGNTAAVTRVPGAALFFGTEYVNDFSVGNIPLAAGTYWLGLHNGPLTTSTRLEFYWETTAINSTGTGREDVFPFGDSSWSNNSQEHAFVLSGNIGGNTIPEPSSFVVFGLASFGLAMVRRNRR